MKELKKNRTGRRNFVMFIGTILIIALASYLVHIPKAYSEPVPGVTDDTILVGLHSALTGPIASYSKSSRLHKAIFEEWGGTIHGRKIKSIILDDGCEPVKGVAALKKLIYDDKVFLVHGGNCSNVCLAARPIFEKSGTPWIINGAGHDAIVVPVVKNIFSPHPVISSWTRTQVDFAMTIPNMKRLGLIRQNDEWSMAYVREFGRYLKERYNMSPVVDVVTERDSADLSPQVLKLREAKVDAVIAFIYVVATTSYLRDAHKFGLDVPYVGTGATTASDQYQSLRSLAPLKKAFFPYWCKYPMDHPKVRVYEDLFKKCCPTETFDAQVVNVTGAPLLIIDALQKCGRDLTQEKFVEILETNYKNWDPDMHLGANPLTFSKTNHIGMERGTMSTIATGNLEVVNTYQDYEKLMKK